MLISVHGYFWGGPGEGSCVLSGVQVKCLCGPCTLLSSGHSTGMEFTCHSGASILPEGWELVLRWFKKKFFFNSFSKKKNNNNNNFVCLFIYFWLCWVFVATKAFSSCGEWGLLLLWGADSAAVAHRLSCSAARGVFLDQGWSPHLLHQQAASLPLSHQKSAHFPDLTLHI